MANVAGLGVGEKKAVSHWEAAQLTAIIEPEGDGYVATCPEVDVVSQGQTVEEARRNLIEAVEGFFEVASPSEIRRRSGPETGTLSGVIRQSGLPRSLFEAG